MTYYTRLLIMFIMIFSFFCHHKIALDVTHHHDSDYLDSDDKFF